MEVTAVDSGAVLTLAGEIDMTSAPQLRQQLADLFGQGVRTIVVDLSRVTFLDSSGLGALVAAHHELAGDGGRLKLAAATPQVQKILQITRLGNVLSLYDSVEQARA